MNTLRDRLVTHITMMRQHEPTYAEKALKWYAKALPWLDLENLK